MIQISLTSICAKATQTLDNWYFVQLAWGKKKNQHYEAVLQKMALVRAYLTGGTGGEKTAEGIPSAIPTAGLVCLIEIETREGNTTEGVPPDIPNYRDLAVL